MFNNQFKRVFLLFFLLTSCQITETTNIRYFKGFFSVKKDQKKQNYPVEVYIDASRPILQINILSPFGKILASYLWRNNQHQIVLPSRKQYFKDTQWPAHLPLKRWLHKPLWLYQALLQQWPKDWKCKEIKKLKKCSKKDFTVEWEKKTFRRSQIRINLKKEDFSLKLQPHKSPSQNSFDMKIPKEFQKIHKMDLFQ